jgi:hypothetical protein
LSKAKQYEKIADCIYNINFDYKDKISGKEIKYSSKDEIIKGIKEKKYLGSFSYSDRSILQHAQMVDQYLLKNNQYLTDTYMIEQIKNDAHLKQLLLTRPDSFWFYMNYPTVLIFLYENQEFKLLFTQNLTVVSDFDPSRQKTSYTDEEFQKKYGHMLKK